MNLKSACFLLSLCHAGFAAAIGLGDASVRSHLGQPLHVVVTLIGATPNTTADCLGLASSPGSIAPPLHAQLSVEQVGSQTFIHIRTAQSVNDPVTQFVLMSDCEAHLQREYAVLLDPPVLVEMARGQDRPSAETQTVSAPVATTAPTRRRPAHVRRAAPAPARATAIRSRLPAPHAIQTAPATRPRLVLSGKHGGVSAPLALRLDTSLPDFNRPHSESLSSTDLSDENTALNHKLAYLEAQLVALQQRNAQLASGRAAAPVAVTPQPPKQTTQWIWYLLAIGLLTGVGALVVGLRRRSRSRPQSPLLVDDTWAQPDTFSAHQADASDPERMQSLVSERMPEMAAPPSELGTEIKEDILDQAEVFMAHGHSELAIHLLQEHLRESPAESPVPWLLLLDLLHRAGDTAAYVTASTECRRYFNVNLDGRAFFSDGENGQGLEAYPHLLEQLVQVWNTPGVKAFFDDLVFDHRGGTRIGFEPGAYRDILLLRSIVHDIKPLQQPE